MQNDNQKKLLRHYLIINLPGIIAFIILYMLGKFNAEIFWDLRYKWLPITMILAEGIFAILLPLWYRIHFVNRKKAHKQTEKQEFIKFEKNFLSLASVSVYILVAGYLTGLPKIPFAVMVIFVIYALYFYFPGEKRVRSEQKIFRVIDNN